MKKDSDAVSKLISILSNFYTHNHLRTLKYCLFAVNWWTNYFRVFLSWISFTESVREVIQVSRCQKVSLC